MPLRCDRRSSLRFQIMNRMFALAAAALMGLAGASVAMAQERADFHDRGRFGPREPHLQLDARYHHDHYYPARGAVVAVLPQGAVSIGFHGGSYFFHGGVWFRPSGGRFVVVAPPVGIVVPVLPPAYATLWIAGAPYYYANGAYYAPAPGGYAIVAPPPGADAAEPLSSPLAAAPPPVAVPAPPPAHAPDPIVYPRNGQSAAQTEADKQECNRWATNQPNALADAGVFQRATAACLDGRGYTVR